MPETRFSAILSNFLLGMVFKNIILVTYICTPEIKYPDMVNFLMCCCVIYTNHL